MHSQPLPARGQVNLKIHFCSSRASCKSQPAWSKELELELGLSPSTLFTPFCPCFSPVALEH